MENEIKFQKELANNPYVVQLLDAWVDGDWQVIALEFADKGELTDYLKETSKNEAEAKRIIKALVTGLSSIHAKQIAHRDIRVQNIMLATGQDGKVTPRFIDFGFAAKFDDEQAKAEPGGSHLYMAPEVWALEPSAISLAATDVYSLGHVAYKLLTGKEIKKTLAAVDPSTYEGLSEGAKTFVASMIAFDPTQRATLATLATNPWLNS
jgi:serine/threonine protein kinase